MDDAAIHRVSEDACGVDGSIAGSQWIATGFALAMTRVVQAGCLFVYWLTVDRHASRGSR